MKIKLKTAGDVQCPGVLDDYSYNEKATDLGLLADFLIDSMQWSFLVV